MTHHWSATNNFYHISRNWTEFITGRIPFDLDFIGCDLARVDISRGIREVLFRLERNVVDGAILDTVVCGNVERVVPVRLQIRDVHLFV